MKYVKIHWRDATSVDEWTDMTTISPECHMIETIGHLVIEDEDTITVALSFDAKGEAYSNFIHIPKGMVVQKKLVKA